MQSLQKTTRVALVTYAMHCGGMETFLLDFARRMVFHGAEVHVITTVERGEWFDKIAATGARSVHVSPPRRFRARQFLRVARHIAEHGYDFVFLNHAIYAQAAMRMLPNSTIAIPILHNDHESIYRVGCANQTAWNVTVAVSPGVKEAAEQRVANRPIVCIPYGVEIPPVDLLTSRQVPIQSIRLIFVSRLVHGQKGVLFLPYILRGCLRRGLDATLTIVGDGQDRELFNNLVRKLDLTSRVEFLGVLPHDQVFRFLADSHVMLLPSFYEGLPIALLEAMAYGCVPIATRLPGVTDCYIRSGINGFLVDIGDVDGFVEALSQLQTNTADWLAMSQAARATIRQSFSLDRMVNDYLCLINECIAGRYALPRSRKIGFPVDIPLIFREFAGPRIKRMFHLFRHTVASKLQC